MHRIREPFSLRFLLCSLLLSLAAEEVPAHTPEELERRFKPLPTVPEDELPPLSGEPGSFRGLIEHEGLEGATWVAFPFVENPGSIGIDPQGRLYVAEANRFWLGVPDLRGANYLIRDDFQSVTVEDRANMYEKHAARFPEGWFDRVADRIIRLEDRSGNGAADHRTVFSDRFREPLDGIGFSLLADEGSVYFTCIPSVWKLTDTTGDGTADEAEEISTGYGVRVSFIGHDLHGIVRGPDGRLYFSVGDRGYHVINGDGETRSGPGRGAVFRCESDGSGLERLFDGLRNPQELAFDSHGNLFTFDNTADIGDLARMVYVLEGADSGWDMSHQSAHHYAPHLDWGDFRPEQSMWVEEKMYDLHSEEQPQWVYPPASHVARGPSGITWLTGESVPEDLREKFLVTDYRGAPENSTTFLVGIEGKGAGYVATTEQPLFKGIAASDVELGFDGSIYLCDFGGGWSVNTNGSIQRIQSKNPAQREAGARVAELFRSGFDQRESKDLTTLLSDSDRRVRQAAQFALVDKGRAGLFALVETARSGDSLFPRLHAIWGLGQVQRREAAKEPASPTSEVAVETLLALLKEGDSEIRANAVRVLGDGRVPAAREPFLALLAEDPSPRVRSLAAIALGRTADVGDPTAVDALFRAACVNGEEHPDIVLRHALLSSLDRLATVESAAKKTASTSREERILSVLLLRRRESARLADFLSDSDPLVVREAIRAIYDTTALDTAAGETLAAFDQNIGALPEPVQRRIIAANYRRGTLAHARRMLKLSARKDLAFPVRKAALQGLKQWENAIDTDPVLGHYRPQVSGEGRKLSSLGEAIAEELRAFLAAPHTPELIALAMELATATRIPLDADTLLAQVINTDLHPGVRVAMLESLTDSGADDRERLVTALLQLGEDSESTVRAASLRSSFHFGVPGTVERAETAIREEHPRVARAALAGIAATSPQRIVEFWRTRSTSVPKELWLDLYLVLREADHPDAAAYAEDNPNQVFHLALHGGDATRGEIVFRNQGACLQCHKIENDGGIQGPDLSTVATRLSREKILESVYDPNAEITPGYGMTTLTLRGGDTLIGRLAREENDHVILMGLDETATRVKRDDIASLAPPVSAMPPAAAAMAPEDLRDLVAFLATRKGEGDKTGDASHGDDEKIAK